MKVYYCIFLINLLSVIKLNYWKLLVLLNYFKLYFFIWICLYELLYLFEYTFWCSVYSFGENNNLDVLLGSFNIDIVFFDILGWKEHTFLSFLYDSLAIYSILFYFLRSQSIYLFRNGLGLDPLYPIYGFTYGLNVHYFISYKDFALFLYCLSFYFLAFHLSF